jgi:hypothetical protein
MLFVEVFNVFHENHNQSHLQAKSVALSAQVSAISIFKNSCSVGTCHHVGQGQFAVDAVVFEKFHHVGFLHSVVKLDHRYNFHHILSSQTALNKFSFAVYVICDASQFVVVVHHA